MCFFLVDLWIIISNFFIKLLIKFVESIGSTINCNYTSVYLHNQLVSKKLTSLIDVSAREVDKLKNEPLFYIYDDGTVEKRIIIH